MPPRLILGLGLLGLALTSPWQAEGRPEAEANPPIDQLLPITTKEYVAIPSVARLEAAFAKTNFGKLFRDPALKEFCDQLGPTSWLPGIVCARLQLTPDEIKAMASGAAGWAYAQPGLDQAAHFVWIDTTGKTDARKRWAEQCAARVVKSGGKVAPEKIGAFDAIAYRTAAGESVYSLVRNDLLLLSDNRDALAEMLARWGGQGNSLADLPAYQAVWKRLGDTGKADLLAFIDPVGRVEVQEKYLPAAFPREKSRQIIRALRKQGVDGLRGVGASLRLASGPHDLFYHVAVHVPGPSKGNLGVVRLKPGKSFAPDPWVPANAASFITAHVDIPAAFDHFGPIYDQFAPGGKEGAWQAWLKDLRDDPRGPQVDLRREIIARLQSRVLFFSAPPAQTDRVLLAIPVIEPEGVKKALRRLFENDEGASVKKVLDHEVWVVEALSRKKGQTPAHTAYCVANDLLCVSNQFEVMQSVLKSETTPQLVASEEYRRVARELERLTPPGARLASQAFLRPELDYRTVYEAARREKLSDLESFHARLAVILASSSEELFTKLPPFTAIAGYFKPAGSMGLLHDDGWEFLGFSLAE